MNSRIIMVSNHKGVDKPFGEWPDLTPVSLLDAIENLDRHRKCFWLTKSRLEIDGAFFDDSVVRRDHLGLSLTRKIVADINSRSLSSNEKTLGQKRIIYQKKMWSL